MKRLYCILLIGLLLFTKGAFADIIFGSSAPSEESTASAPAASTEAAETSAPDEEETSALPDAEIWAALMQPITVYDGGLDQRDHVYLTENADGSGARIAQIHAQSQALFLLGEETEHGTVLCATYSSYDDVYFPSEEQMDTAFELKTGYIKAAGLKQVEVQRDYALLVDKSRQRMSIFAEGERVAELMISTGLIKDGKPWQETPLGCFITVSHVGPFSTHKYMQSEMAIRISGGILIHEVPYEPLGDGSRRYTDFESQLGEKASAGCVRVQRLEDENGYNQKWIWENFTRSRPYKVMVVESEADVLAMAAMQ